MKTKGIFTKPLTLPDFIFIFSVLAVLISVAIFYLIDLRNAFGLRDSLFSTSGAFFFYSYEPFFFHQWGRSGGLAEIIQWTFLGMAAIVAAYSAARVSFINKNLKVFWTILSVVLIFMLLEDAGGVRHTIMGYVQWVFNEPDQGIMGTSVEFLYFAALGGAPLYALIRYWKDIKAYVKSMIYLLIGFVFYGVSQALSFVGTAFEGLVDKNIYDLMGERFYQFALRIGDPGLRTQWETWSAERYFSIRFSLMDSFVEENLELIGSAALLAAVISFLIYLRKDRVFS